MSARSIALPSSTTRQSSKRLRSRSRRTCRSTSRNPSSPRSLRLAAGGTLRTTTRSIFTITQAGTSAQAMCSDHGNAARIPWCVGALLGGGVHPANTTSALSVTFCARYERWIASQWYTESVSTTARQEVLARAEWCVTWRRQRSLRLHQVDLIKLSRRERFLCRHKANHMSAGCEHVQARDAPV